MDTMCGAKNSLKNFWEVKFTILCQKQTNNNNNNNNNNDNNKNLALSLNILGSTNDYNLTQELPNYEPPDAVIFSIKLIK